MAIPSPSSAYSYRSEGDCISGQGSAGRTIASAGFLLCNDCQPWNAHILHDCTARLFLVWLPCSWRRAGANACSWCISQRVCQRHGMSAQTTVAASATNHHVWFGSFRIWVSFDAYNKCCVRGRVLPTLPLDDARPILHLGICA